MILVVIWYDFQFLQGVVIAKYVTHISLYISCISILVNYIIAIMFAPFVYADQVELLQQLIWRHNILMEETEGEKVVLFLSTIYYTFQKILSGFHHRITIGAMPLNRLSINMRDILPIRNI